MKLHELLKSADWADVAASLRGHHNVTEEDLEKFDGVLLRLQAMTPGPDDGSCIVVDIEGNVDGRRGSDQFALDYLPWATCLAMDVECTPIPIDRIYSELRKDMIAHILWELTFYGMDEDTIKAKGDDLRATARLLEMQRRVSVSESALEVFVRLGKLYVYDVPDTNDELGFSQRLWFDKSGACVFVRDDGEFGGEVRSVTKNMRKWAATTLQGELEYHQRQVEQFKTDVEAFLEG